MCIICTLWEQDKLTRYEASQALSEMIQEEQIDSVHAVEVWDKLSEAFKVYKGADFEEQEEKKEPDWTWFP